MKKIIDKLKNIPKKIYIVFIAIIVLIVLTIMILSNLNKLTKLEEIKIEEFSNKIVNHIEEFMNTNDEGKYICYAIENLYNNSDKVEFTSKEVLEIINTTFNVNYTNETILDIGITPKMLDKGITYDVATSTYTYKSDKTRIDIANSKIIKYELTNIKKNGKDRFLITYKKYVIENPYDILNYYNNLNIEQDNNYDTTIISEYLKGNKKISELKNSIDNKDITNYGKYDSEISLELIIKDNTLVINK